MTVFVNTTICGDEPDAAPVELEATGPGATPRGLSAVGGALHHSGRSACNGPYPCHFAHGAWVGLAEGQRRRGAVQPSH